MREHGHLFDRVLYTQAGFSLLERRIDGQEGRHLLSHYPTDASLSRSDFRIRSASIAETLRYLERLAAVAESADVFWIGPRVEPHIPLNQVVRIGCAGEFRMRHGQEDLFVTLGGEVARQAEPSPVHYIDQIGVANFSITEDFINCRDWFWRDGDHWSLAGAEEFTRRIYQEFEIARSDEHEAGVRPMIGAFGNEN